MYGLHFAQPDNTPEVNPVVDLNSCRSQFTIEPRAKSFRKLYRIAPE